MATLKEFEDALRQQGMTTALSILDTLRERDRATRRAAPARRVTGRKMTPELAHRILELHGSTKMTQQEIAFELGVNQGRVNEVIKRGKWLDGNPNSPEALARDRAVARVKSAKPREVLVRRTKPRAPAPPVRAMAPALARAVVPPARAVAAPAAPNGQLSFGDL